MKQLTITNLGFLLLLSLSSSLFAQQSATMSRAFQPDAHPNSILAHQVGADSSSYIWNVFTGGTVACYQFSASGEYVNAYTVAYKTAIWDFQVNVVPDGTMGYFLGDECDVTVPPTLTKWDTGGALSWEISLDFSDTICFLPETNSTFWLFYHNLGKVERRSYQTGTLLTTLNMAQPVFNQYVEVPTGQILAYGNGGLGLYSRDLSSQSFALPQRYILDADVLANGNFVALSQDSLYLLDPQLQVLKQEYLFPTITDNYWCGVETEGDRIFMILSAEQWPLWVERDANLQEVQTATLPEEKGFRVTRFAVRDSQVYLAGDHTPAVKAIKRLPLGPPQYQHNTDIAITAVTSPDSIVITEVWPNNFFAQWTNISVTLKNTGQHPIDRARLNSIFPTLFSICPLYNAFETVFDDLALEPGEMTTVLVPQIGWGLMGNGNFPSDYSVQFWASVPQDSIESNTQNNIGTGQGPIKVVSSTNEAAAVPLHAYPNPATQQFTIELPDGLDGPFQVTVFNAAGAVQRVWETAGPMIQIERGAMPAGFCFAQVRTGTGKTGVAKWVWAAE